MLNLIALDVDGVLNSQAYMHANPGCFARDWVDMLDPVACARLADLLERSKASIVISSTWRIGRTLDEMRELLYRRGIRAPVLGMTPLTHRLGEGWTERGDEIQGWLDENMSQEAYRLVILDDDSDMAHLSSYHVKTSWATGLLDGHVEQAIKLFEDQP